VEWWNTVTGWIDTEKVTVAVAFVALLVAAATWLSSRRSAPAAQAQAGFAKTSAEAAVVGTIISNKSAQSSEESAVAAKKQAESAHGQLEMAMRQVQLAQKVHRDSMEPYVIVDIAQSPDKPSILELTIENIGPTIAFNVRIKFDPPLERSFEKSESENLIEIGRCLRKVFLRFRREGEL
jgi:hypothetical protein